MHTWSESYRRKIRQRIQEMQDRSDEVKVKLNRSKSNIFRHLLLEEMFQLEKNIAELEIADRGRVYQKLELRTKRSDRAVDKRKAAIAEIKRNSPNISALEICKKMDRRAESDRELEPKHWKALLWVRAYRQSPAKVRTYISKIKGIW